MGVGVEGYTHNDYDPDSTFLMKKNSSSHTFNRWNDYIISKSSLNLYQDIMLVGVTNPNHYANGLEIGIL